MNILRGLILKSNSNYFRINTAKRSDLVIVINQTKMFNNNKVLFPVSTAEITKVNYIQDFNINFFCY